MGVDSSTLGKHRNMNIEICPDHIFIWDAITMPLLHFRNFHVGLMDPSSLTQVRQLCSRSS